MRTFTVVLREHSDEEITIDGHPSAALRREAIRYLRHAGAMSATRSARFGARLISHTLPGGYRNPIAAYSLARFD